MLHHKLMTMAFCTKLILLRCLRYLSLPSYSNLNIIRMIWWYWIESIPIFKFWISCSRGMTCGLVNNYQPKFIRTEASRNALIQLYVGGQHYQWDVCRTMYELALSEPSHKANVIASSLKSAGLIGRLTEFLLQAPAIHHQCALERPKNPMNISGHIMKN